MLSLNLLKLSAVNRLCATSTQYASSTQCLSTVTIKLDGKQVNIKELPKKPKRLDLFQNYCAEMGVSGDELKRRHDELRKSFVENKSSYLAKNQKLVNSYKDELKAYRELYKKKIQLKDVSDLIDFYNKTTAKKVARKPRIPSFFNFFVKHCFQTGQAKYISDIKKVSDTFHNLTPSELDHYKRLYEEFLRTYN